MSKISFKTGSPVHLRLKPILYLKVHQVCMIHTDKKKKNCQDAWLIPSWVTFTRHYSDPMLRRNDLWLFFFYVNVSTAHFYLLKSSAATKVLRAEYHRQARGSKVGIVRQTDTSQGLALIPNCSKAALTWQPKPVRCSNRCQGIVSILLWATAEFASAARAELLTWPSQTNRTAWVGW